MNLGRAKLILIVAFTGLNLFMSYHLFWPDFGRLTRVAVTVEDQRIAEVFLNHNNYFLDTAINRAVQTSDFLTVTPDQNVQRILLARFIEGGAEIDFSDNVTYCKLDDEQVAIHPNGFIQTIFIPSAIITEHDITAIEERELLSLVESFLKSKDLYPQGIQYDYIEVKDDKEYIIHYYQLIDNTAVYASQLKVFITNGQVSSVETFWLDLEERFPFREIEVISALEALTNMVHEIGASAEPRTIKQINLGFFSVEYDAEKWEIPPVWRIVLDNNKRFYINAFTGNLEQDTTIIPDQLP
ncbi:MAG: two-component system regulatory protein YycI [Bacillota bacterium]|nr:two-component system regulatory protein YycI [Bacillota bacterium]